jgi:hypothetical protein
MKQMWVFIALFVGVVWCKVDRNQFIKNKKTYQTYKSMAKSKKLPPHNIVCIPEKKSVCTQESCSAIAPQTFSLIQKVNGLTQISRCDKSGCDTYPANFSESGVNWNFQTKEPKGLLLKINFIEDNLSFVEIATQMLDVYMSYGKCLEEGN